MTLSSFLSKLLLGRQLEWTEQGLKIMGKDFSMQPMNVLVFLQGALKKKDILYNSAKDSFFQFSKEMSKYAPNKDLFMKYMFALINHMGFGNLKIIEIKENSAKLQLAKNNFASTYRKSFGRQQKPVDYILSGILAGFFSAYFEKKVECEEKFCIAQGKNACSFFVHQ